MIQLTNKVALVTGGSRGIGAATVLMLAEAGATVAFTYNSDRKSAEAIADRTVKSGNDCLMIQADVSNLKDVQKTVKAVLSHYKQIDILVNNAGIWKRGEMGKMSEKQWSETLDINLKGTFFFCNEVVPIMKKQKRGKIINIASTAGQRGEPYHSHYAASKGGMIAFTKSLGAELAPHNIIANCVSPGWIDTDMSAGVLHDRKLVRDIVKIIPRGKPGSPEDIAGAVVFLASELSNNIIGASINVNGGSVLFG